MNIKSLVVYLLPYLIIHCTASLLGQNDTTFCGNAMSDIVITCDDLNGTALAIWEPPTGNISCSSCSEDTTLAGFTYLGDRGGHRYYISQQKALWSEAYAASMSLNGYLAVINDPAENQFLISFLQEQAVFIGLTDADSEGDFYWVNGDSVSYTNWFKMQPNNRDSEQHYGQLLASGKWNDTYNTDSLQFLLEIPCMTVQQTRGYLNGSSFPAGETTLVNYEVADSCGNQATCSFTVQVVSSLTLHVPNDVSFPCQSGFNGTSVFWLSPYATSCCDNCPTPDQNLEGFNYIGRYNGHQYYYFLEEVTWQAADSIATHWGGYLATVNDAAENQLLTNFLAGRSAYIGLTDRVNEGRFVWSNGESVLYQNWHRGQPNNANDAQDYVMMLGNGYWDDIYDNQKVAFIMELPCLEVSRIDKGPERGGVFPTGTTTITYEATDNCGNTTQQSFDINIGSCAVSDSKVCESAASNADFFWIKQVRLGSINNYTSANGGYKDFPHLSTILYQDDTQMLTLAPGFANGATDVYWRVFIDYNQDGDFYDSGETVFSYKHANPLQVSFQIPNTSKVGITTMRVAMKFGGHPEGCENFSYGEVEDYRVQIVESKLKDTMADSRGKGQEVIVLESEYLPFMGDLSEFLVSPIPTMQLYPNPTSSQVTIDVQNLSTINTSTLHIYNNLGQQVYVESLPNNHDQKILLPVEHLETGIYFISLDSGDHLPILQKFTKL